MVIFLCLPYTRNRNFSHRLCRAREKFIILWRKAENFIWQGNINLTSSMSQPLGRKHSREPKIQISHCDVHVLYSLALFHLLKPSFCYCFPPIFIISNSLSISQTCQACSLLHTCTCVRVISPTWNALLSVLPHIKHMLILH